MPVAEGMIAPPKKSVRARRTRRRGKAAGPAGTSVAPMALSVAPKANTEQHLRVLAIPSFPLYPPNRSTDAKEVN